MQQWKIDYDDAHHHPREKMEQLLKHIPSLPYKNVLELFAGKGNLTEFYYYNCRNNHSLTRLSDIEDMINLKVGMHVIQDTEIEIFNLIAKKKKFNLIDVDGYGNSGELIKNIFHLTDSKIGSESYILWTFPSNNCGYKKSSVQKLRDLNLWGAENPKVDDFVKTISHYASQHYYKTELISAEKFNLNHNTAYVNRFIVKATRVNAKELTKTKDK